MAKAEATLCMLRAYLPFEEEDDRFALVEAETARRFERAGFSIVPSEEVMAMFDRIDEEFGEIYDPLDGRILPERLEEFEAALAAGFRDEMGCDARLRASLVVVRARYANYGASWDGVSRQVNSTGRAVLMALAGVHESGWVQASSLRIELADVEGELVGFRSAGVEPHVAMSISRSLDKLPPDRWLRNDELVQDAFDQALGPAAEKMRDAGRPLGRIDLSRLAWPSTP